MSFLFTLLGIRRPPPGPQCPPTVPGDEVVPVPFFDDQDLYRKMFLSFTFQFDHVLDPEKLRDSLSCLIQKPGWKKLGGRIRLEKDGKLYLHIPRRFTEARPAIGYAHSHFDCSAQEHSLASELFLQQKQAPRGDRPRLLPPTSRFRSLAVRPGGPTSLPDLLHSDEPQLSLHVVTFTDATLTSLTCSHVSLDGMALSALLSGWSSVLAGREPLEALPHTVDPAAGLGLKDVPHHPLKSKVLSFWGSVGFALRSAVDRLSDPGVESRTVFLPGPWVEDLRRECLQEISSPPSSPSAPPTPVFLSTNDVLMAYITRTFTTVNLPPRKPVAMLSLADVRCRLPARFAASVACLANLLVLCPTYTTPAALRGLPLGRTARRVRESLVAQTARADVVEGTLHLGRRMHEVLPLQKKAPYKTAIALGSCDAFRTVVTSWERMRFYDVLDLGPAVVGGGGGGGDGDDGRGAGKPVFYFADTLSGGDNPWRHSWVVFGRDPRGDYWASGWLPRGTWRSVDRDIREGKIDAVLDLE